MQGDFHGFHTQLYYSKTLLNNEHEFLFNKVINLFSPQYFCNTSDNQSTFINALEVTICPFQTAFKRPLQEVCHLVIVLSLYVPLPHWIRALLYVQQNMVERMSLLILGDERLRLPSQYLALSLSSYLL